MSLPQFSKGALVKQNFVYSLLQNREKIGRKNTRKNTKQNKTKSTPQIIVN